MITPMHITKNATRSYGHVRSSRLARSRIFNSCSLSFTAISPVPSNYKYLAKLRDNMSFRYQMLNNLMATRAFLLPPS